eukprot:231659-Rhodomonas_salina.1
MVSRAHGVRAHVFRAVCGTGIGTRIGYAVMRRAVLGQRMLLCDGPDLAYAAMRCAGMLRRDGTTIAYAAMRCALLG